MYPRLSDIFQDLFGFSLPFPIYSFGAMVAVAVLLAAWLTKQELDRMYAAGRVGSVKVPVEQKNGKTQRRGGKPVLREASPSALVWTIAMLAIGLGVAGSKLFHILENLDQFALDPAGMIFSSGGLTYYGGLICAGVGIAWYARSKKLQVPPLADAIAPGLMLGYGVGRIGCYLAGDGDWGVCSYLADKPGWMPDWLWSEAFVNSHLGVSALVYENCPPGADGVYPTMLYEFAACTLLFGLLWAVRNHRFKSGWLFSLYLVFNGVERFFIEKIRVNNTFDLFGLTVTQAEIISVLIIVTGVVGLAFTTRARTGDLQEAVKG
ncbi:MAG: prolipoprotein diacylglyceryl transferase family protein [Bacteroidota bacterium]